MELLLPLPAASSCRVSRPSPPPPGRSSGRWSRSPAAAPRATGKGSRGAERSQYGYGTTLPLPHSLTQAKFPLRHLIRDCTSAAVGRPMCSETSLPRLTDPDTVSVVRCSKPPTVLGHDCSALRCGGVFLEFRRSPDHFDSVSSLPPISPKGVTNAGTNKPSSSSRGECARICLFAKCRQFQVTRKSHL